MSRFALLVLLVTVAAGLPAQTPRAEGSLQTRWAQEVDRALPWPEYPRPTMRRPSWKCLNGPWHYAIRDRAAPRPEEAEGEILVPFPVESQLSGVQRHVGPEHRLWCWRRLDVPAAWRGQRILLHFDAVDWETQVWIDDACLGTHRGGYDRFGFDVTEHLDFDRDQTLTVAIWDPSDAGPQPRGKQVREPRGIWYTPSTGIWQTVWLEPVPRTAIIKLKVGSDVDRSRIHLRADVHALEPGDRLVARVFEGRCVVAVGEGPAAEPVEIPLNAPRLWSPEDPHLYDLRVELHRGAALLDAVRSYCGLRKISLAPGPHGAVIHINGAPLFQIGPLDQGFWPDGLYTAPSDAALRYDIEVTKRAGFNMARKHVKVEPERWYWHCDRLGLAVWQDMPSGDRYAPSVQADDPRAEIERSPESARQFEAELAALIAGRGHHPSILTWVIFNEGWGQYATRRLTAEVRASDPSRLVIGSSGWNDLRSGDIADVHRYPGPGMSTPEKERAVVLGEFGGLGLPVPGHLWWDKRNWGYRNLQTRNDLRRGYETLLLELHALKAAGLSAGVYTQTTDVEGEVNGLMTYDRAVLKIDPDRLAEIHRGLEGPPPRFRALSPTAEHEAPKWRYSFASPAGAWQDPAFDATSWKRGLAGFGREETPGARVGTPWTGDQIWLRRRFVLEEVPPAELWLRIHHDEAAEVFLNGARIAQLAGYTTSYGWHALLASAAQHLRPGQNLLAVHCQQTSGGQFIDVGLYVRVE